jgi:PIN domain nuclease of toxin-antitoxin system
MKLLLDTCTFLWIVSGARELPERIIQAYRAPENEIYLSAASAWEIAVKHALGKLPLPSAPQQFVHDQRESHAIATLVIDEESALHLSRLPALHRDPFDRMLVSQSIVHGLTILTPDPLITQYPGRTMW